MKIQKNICALMIFLCAALFVAGCDGSLLDITDLAVNGIPFLARWAGSTVSAGSFSEFGSTAVGPDGSVYAAGVIDGNQGYVFGDITVNGAYTGKNAVLVKYNNNGTVLWAKSVGETSPGTIDNSLFYAVSAGDDGSVYAAGVIYGSGEYDFGDGVTVSGGCDYPNSVIVKYSSEGTALWARSTVIALSASSFNSVTVGSDGSVYAVGVINGQDNFNFGNECSVSGKFDGVNAVIVKYDNTGNALWARCATTAPSISLFYSVTAGNDGSVYAAGLISSGTYIFYDNASVDGVYSSDNPLLVKFNSDGTALWARSTESASTSSFFRAITTGPDGAVYTAGIINSDKAVNFGNGVEVAGAYSGGDNAVIVAYLSNGTVQWARSVEGPSRSEFKALATSPDGSVYAAGTIQQLYTYSFGQGVTATGINIQDNMVLVKYSPIGSALVAHAMYGGSSQSNLWALGVSGNGSVYAAGSIYGEDDFDPGNAISVSGAFASGLNALLVKYK